MNYSKTFAGLIVIMLGWIGIGSIFTQTEVGQIIDLLVQLVGVIYVAITRYKKGDITAFGFKK